MSTGLYTGRFQPFHLGHLSAIRQALKEVDRLYIAIGSSQYDHQPENPFTGKERKQMIGLALKEIGLSDQCDIFLVPDIHNDEKWTGHVRSIVPDFQHVFVGDEGLVKRLFETYDSAEVHLLEREVDVSATEIRTLMQKKGEWERLVPKAVIGYLKKDKNTAQPSF